MNNADKFKQIFDLYATELWAMSEKDFLAWLNAECDVPDTNVGNSISRQAALNEIDKNRQELLSLGMDGAEHILVHYGRRVIEELPTIDIPERKDDAWNMFELVTSVYYGKQYYFLQDDGLVYSRASYKYMTEDAAIDEFLDAIGE